MPTLFKRTPDGAWMPFSVPEKNIPGLLLAGWRREIPGAPKAPETSNVVPLNASATGLKINSASVKELSEEIKGVGLVTARRLVDARPFHSIEDLIAFKDDIDWMAIAIDYSESPENNDR